jgi:hypothetical protein
MTHQKPHTGVLVMATVLCVALWAAPSLVPAREPAISPVTAEQSARLNLYLTSLRVREYRAANKRLPESLAIIGVDSTGLGYSRLTRSEFELSTRVNNTSLVYKSSVPDSVFLGEDLRVEGNN